MKVESKESPIIYWPIATATRLFSEFSIRKMNAMTRKQDVLVDGDNVYRATYIIDEEGVVFHEGVNHMPIGRNVNEYLRIIDALTHVQEKGEVCPANWEDGKDAMNESRQRTKLFEQ